MKASYNSHSNWRAYERWFPSEWRCDVADPPAEEWWPWRDGEIHVDRYTEPGARVKMIVLHGGGGYGRMFASYANAARRHGAEIVVPDLPGYGITEVGDKRQVSYEDWIECAAELVEGEHYRDGRPIVVFGVSIGGMLAYEVTARTRRPAALAATCLLDPRDVHVRDAVARNLFASRLGGPLLRAFPRLTDGLMVPVRLTSKMSKIANDRALVRTCTRDQLGGGNHMPARFLRTYLESVPSVEPEQFDVCPVLLAHPMADRWTDLAVSKPFFDRIAAPKQLVELDRCGHLPFEQPGLATLDGALASLIERVATDTSS